MLQCNGQIPCLLGLLLYGTVTEHSFTYVLTLSTICRSLSIFPMVAVYNNRAQAEIKLQRWHRALQDCQRVLELEPLNLKGAFESWP